MDRSETAGNSGERIPGNPNRKDTSKMYGRTGQTTPHTRRTAPKTAPIEVRIYNCERRIEGYRNEARRAEQFGWGQYKIDHALNMAAAAQAKLATLIAEAEAAEVAG